MSDILVFSPPAPDTLPKSVENCHLGSVCGWLRDEGFDFDQRSLFVECRYLNRFRFRRDVIDLSVFEPGRVVDYLQGGEDEEIAREARKMGELLDIDSYKLIIIPLENDQIISVRDPRLFIAFPILKECISDDQRVVVGGTELSEEMEFARLSYVDYAVDGDLEIPLSRILRHEFEGESLDVEPGIMVERDGELLRGDPYQHPLDMKARPYFDTEILEKFKKISALDISVIPYKIGHGCTQDCSFCTYFEDQSYQHKSVDKVVEDIRALKEETGISNFWFTDANLLNDPDFVRDLAVRLREEDLDVSWAGLSIIVPRDQEFFDTLAAGGCVAFYHGIESASDSVLHRMQKAQTREMVESTLEKEYRAGIKPYALLLTDYVDESWEEYFETVDFVRQNPYLMGAEASSLQVFPDERQPLYRNPEKHDIEIEESSKNWMGLDYKFNLSFSDSRGEMGTSESHRRQLKRRYLRRSARIYLFLKNFGTRHPVTFIRLVLKKLYMKSYTDITHEYV